MSDEPNNVVSPAGHKQFKLRFEHRIDEVVTALENAMAKGGIKSPEFREAMDALTKLLAEIRQEMPETARELDRRMGRLDTEIANEKKEMSALLTRLRTTRVAA